MIEKITNQNQIARHKLAEKINELVDAVNKLQEEAENNARIRADHEHKIEEFQAKDEEIAEWIAIVSDLRSRVPVVESRVSILEEHAHPTATTDRMIGCTTLDIPKSYKNDQLTLATLDYSKKLQKENSDLKDEVELLQKKLEIAVDTLKLARDIAVVTSVARGLEPKEDEINIATTKALEQITALEQKEE